MRITSDFRLRMALMLAAVLLSTLPGWAQTYPSRPVQLIVGYPQGGAGEVAAWFVAEELAKALGQPVNVECA
jgi:tripartite-type tricarboxylate transporter receptor subunit TctC